MACACGMRAGLTLPARNPAGSRVRVVAPVLRGGLVGEDFVEGHVVPIDAVTRNYRNDRWVHAQVTDQRGHGDVQDVVAEASAVGPTAGDNSAAESRLDRAPLTPQPGRLAMSACVTAGGTALS